MWVSRTLSPTPCLSLVGHVGLQYNCPFCLRSVRCPQWQHGFQWGEGCKPQAATGSAALQTLFQPEGFIFSPGVPEGGEVESLAS